MPEAGDSLYYIDSGTTTCGTITCASSVWTMACASTYTTTICESTYIVFSSVSALPTKAEKRARRLLLSNLTIKQRKTFKKNNWFVIEGGLSGRRYRINGNGFTGNIDVLADNDNIEHRLCGHFAHDSDCPVCDHLLAQKLMIENAEEEFLRLANRQAA